MVFGLKKRQAGAAERKRKREEKEEKRAKLKRVEKRAKEFESKRLKKAELKSAKQQAIKRGKEGAHGKSGIFYKIGKAASKEASRWGEPDEKPKKASQKPKSRAKPKKKIGVGSISRVRKFNGVKYQLSSSHGTKKLAQKKATYFKNKGESVRVVKTQKGWSVYIK